MSDQRAELEWRADTVPVSRHFDDPYFSLENGLAETRHVFLAGNGLPERFHDGFHIAELGFGTGLNLLAALHLWRSAGCTGQLRFTSFEAFPLSHADMIRAQSGFPELAGIAADIAPLLAANPTRVDLPDLCFRLVIGDARETLPAWDGAADAWFLDGFSPARNPQLWEGPLLQQVARKTARGGTAATYTAAGFVRRGLQDAGFEVCRTKGFGRKRHMTTARLLP